MSIKETPPRADDLVFIAPIALPQESNRKLPDGSIVKPGQDYDYFEAYGLDKNNSKPGLVPWYKDHNNETGYLMNLLTNNPIVRGILETKARILYGSGPKLFIWETVDGKRQKIELPWDDYPDEIRNFYEFNELDTWAAETFTDHQFLGNFFTHLVFNKGSQTVKKRVNEIVRFTPETVRAKTPASRNSRVDEYFISDTWRRYNIKTLPTIRAFNHKDFYNSSLAWDPSRNKAESLLVHGRFRIPHFNIYSPPAYYGARKLLEVQNALPVFHSANLLNMFGLRIRISVSRNYVNEKMQLTNPSTNKKWTEGEIKQAVTDSMQSYFIDPTNAGKALVTVHDYDQKGEPIHDIVFDPIEVDTKDEFGTKLNPVIYESVTSSTGLDPAISGIIVGGKLSSGSEKAYAWNIEVTKGQRDRDLILKPLRFCHRFNGWDKKYFWDFGLTRMVTADNDADRNKEIQNPTEPV